MDAVLVDTCAALGVVHLIGSCRLPSLPGRLRADSGSWTGGHSSRKSRVPEEMYGNRFFFGAMSTVGTARLSECLLCSRIELKLPRPAGLHECVPVCGCQETVVCMSTPHEFRGTPTQRLGQHWRPAHRWLVDDRARTPEYPLRFPRSKSWCRDGTSEAQDDELPRPLGYGALTIRLAHRLRRSFNSSVCRIFWWVSMCRGVPSPSLIWRGAGRTQPRDGRDRM